MDTRDYQLLAFELFFFFLIKFFSMGSVSEESTQVSTTTKQQLFVLRHGQRIDDADPAWRHPKGARTWDPPLSKAGMEQAVRVGVKLRLQGVQISRIIVSPFLRCVETAAGFIKGMYPDSDGSSSAIANVKVCIEYGLAELMNKRAIRYPPLNPQSSQVWNLSLDELIAALPLGVVDGSVSPVFPQLPNWEESYEDGHRRYIKTFIDVADMFKRENILCISHGEGLAISYSNFSTPKVSVKDVQGMQHCAYTQAEREVFSETSKSPINLRSSWKLLTSSGFELKKGSTKL